MPQITLLKRRLRGGSYKEIGSALCDSDKTRGEGRAGVRDRVPSNSGYSMILQFYGKTGDLLDKIHKIQSRRMFRCMFSFSSKLKDARHTHGHGYVVF